MPTSPASRGATRSRWLSEGRRSSASKRAPVNFAKLQLIREHFDLQNLDFQREGVKDFRLELHGEFDVVLALGILYHLDRPARWLAQISPAVRKVLLIDTHYAPREDEGARRIRPSLGSLGPLESMDAGGWVSEGRWVSDLPEGADRESLPWAAYSNARSFWLTKESLLHALRRSGFPTLLEQYDVWLDHYRTFETECPRSRFVAIKDRG